MFKESFIKYDFPLLGYIRLPSIKIDEEDKGLLNITTDISNQEYLKLLIEYGLKKWVKSGKIKNDELSKYKERVDKELNTIINLQFTDYIIIVYKVINFCRKNGILTGPGRGSAGGSLILALTDVTYKCDPLKDELLFERFISEARAQVKVVNEITYVKSSALPDVDLDINYIHKDKVRRYLEELYPNRTSQICTLNHLSSKILVKDVVKTLLNYSEESAKMISDMIEKSFGKVESINSAIQENAAFKKWAAEQENKEAVDIMLKLHGLIRNKSVHPSAILISYDEIDGKIPLELSSDKKIVASFDMDYAQNFGIKLDILGIKTLEVVAETLKLVNKTIDDIDIRDKSIYDYLRSTDCYYGLFQVEEGLGKETLKKISPNNPQEISLSIALGRPGSMKFIDDYCKFKNEGINVNIDERIKDILISTGGFIIFQEQLMALCVRMANFSLIDADGIRKATGKKIREKMLSYKEKFINGSVQNGYVKEFAEKMWETFEDSANYSFNKSHSTCYGNLTAITTYLKANHPQEFYVALLKMAKHEPNTLEVIGQIEMELRERGIQLLQPNLIKSDLDFTIEGKGIRFGLGSIKGIAGKNIEKLIQFRKPYSNKFELLEAARQAKIPSNILGALIMSGCLDEIVANRPKVLAEAAMWWILSAKEKQLCLSLGVEYNFDLFALFKFLKTANNGEGKPYIKPSRLETIRKHFEPHQNLYLENKKVAELTAYVFEKSLLGYSYSTTLKNVYSKACKELISIGDIKYLEEKDSVIVIGEVIESKTGKSQKGSRYWKGEITDETGTFGVMIFNDKMQDSFEINGCHPKEGDILFVRGQKFDTKIFANEISIQDQQVATSIRKLKDISGTKLEG
jgi:DNA polymerase-3 subunit alpha